MKARYLYLAQLLLLGSSVAGCGRDDESPEDEFLQDCRIQGDCDVAPSLDRTVATSLTEAAQFLYTGDEPLQQDVEEGALDERRVAIMRGRVVDVDGEPLLGARVSIVGHDDWGWTYTRKDGYFDLAVNGGGRLVVNYEKQDHLPAQRAAQPAWQTYETVPEVALAERSQNKSGINPNNGGLQVAEGDETGSGDEAHRPVVLFEPETKATALLPDGSKEELGGMTVRVSEYPFAAPDEDGEYSRFSAGTPSSSGLSYALGFSVDQAEKLEAESVEFSKPVTVYVENFLELDTGVEVPFGYYDPDEGDWEQDEPMVVVEVVGESDGQARLDTDGDGKADSEDELEELHITDRELKELANRYDKGQTLWRARVTHFSEYQGDFPLVPPPTAVAPSVATPKVRPLATTTRRGMSRVESQASTQTVPVIGTPISLYYQSNRTSSFGAAYDIEVPLIGEEVPDGLIDVQVDVSVAGQTMSTTVEPESDLSHSFEWDGRDGHGRLVQGQQRAKVTVRYRYPGEVRLAKRSGNGWATRTVSSGSDGGETYSTLKQVIEFPVGTWDAGGYELGGFSFDALHAFDPVRKTLHFGNGDTKYAENVALVVDRPAVDEDLGEPDSIFVAPDGSAYVSDDKNGRILRITSDERVSVMAGEGAEGEAGDMHLETPQGIVGRSDGSIVFSDFNNSKIWQVSPSGDVRLLLGDKRDDDAEVQADIDYIEGLALGPNEEIYVVNAPSVYRLRGNTLELFAGVGEDGELGDGGPAVDAFLHEPSGVVAAPDGTVYISEKDGHRIRKVTPDGTIYTIAGTGEAGFSGDGDLAANAEVSEPRGLALAPDGTLYFSDRANDRIRLITPDGRIQTVAGGGEASEEDGQVATSVAILQPDGIAMGRDGHIWASAKAGLYRIRPGAPDVLGGQTLVPSKDARTLYRFDSRGKHQETIDAVTGVVQLSFGYDDKGYLVGITDTDGLKTTIERNDKGRATAVVGPFGHETKLSMDGARLSKVVDPLEREKLFEYEEGLLTVAEDAEGGRYEFEYDKNSRLTSVTDPTGSKESYKRTNYWNGYKVGVTTASGASQSFTVRSGYSGDLKHTFVGFDGQTQEMTDRIMTKNYKTIDGSKRFVMLAADEYFGPQSVYTAISETTTPGGLVRAVYPQVSKTVSDIDNALSVETWADIVEVNGRMYESKYDRGARTLTTLTPEGRKQVIEFDERGRAIEVRPAGITKRTMAYNKDGQLVGVQQGSNRETTTDYDSYGFPLLSVNALGDTTGYEYDIAGRLLVQSRPDDQDVLWSWDNNDNVTAITPAGKKAHSFTYSDSDMLTLLSPPKVDDEDLGGMSYSYGADGELELITKPDGSTIAFEYDWAKRLKKATVGDVRLTYEYNLGSRPSAVNRSDSVKVSHSFDGPLWTGDVYSGDVMQGQVQAAYDDNFWLTELTVNKSTSSWFVHDDDGLVVVSGIGDDQFDVYRSENTGQVTRTEFGAIDTNRGYNEFGELESLSASTTSELFSQNIERDDLGRVSTLTEVIGGTTSEVSYSYDVLGRLTEADRDGTVTSYTYDSNGNRTEVAVDGATESEASYDEQDRLVSYGDWTFEHNDSGDLMRRTAGSSSLELEYDALGNLLTADVTNGAIATNIEYKIDGKGRRVARRVDGAYDKSWLYQDDLRPVAEMTSAGVTSHFVYTEAGLGGAPEFMRKGADTYRFVRDHLGSVRMVVNVATGTVMQELEYTAFGEVLVDSNPGFQPFGFAGGLYDADTGLVRFGARDYDPKTGRWTAKDHIGFAGGQMNLLVYVGNDPVNFVDPTGKWGMGLSLYVVAGLGARFGHSDGSWFFKAEAGFGLGGGLSIDFAESFPVKDECYPTGYAGTAGMIGAQIGPWSPSIGGGVAQAYEVMPNGGHRDRGAVDIGGLSMWSWSRWGLGLGAKWGGRIGKAGTVCQAGQP